MRVWLFILLIFLAVYLYQIAATGFKLYQVKNLKQNIKAKLRILYPVYKNVMKQAKQSKQTVEDKSVDRKFVAALKKQDKYAYFKELMYLLPQVRDFNPYLIRYIHVGKRFNQVTNCHGMLQINQYLGEAQDNLTAELKQSFIPTTALMKFLELPAKALSSLGVPHTRELTAQSLGSAVWIAMIGLYYFSSFLLQPLTNLFASSLPF